MSAVVELMLLDIFVTLGYASDFVSRVSTWSKVIIRVDDPACFVFLSITH